MPILSLYLQGILLHRYLKGTLFLMRLDTHTSWPSLPYEDWEDTLATLHMWTQVVGKTKLALAPFLNQWWQVTFFVTTSGMTTGLIPFKNGAFEVIFNFINHTLSIQVNNGKKIVTTMRPQSVASFYYEFMSMLCKLGIEVKIKPTPTEVESPIPFEEDNQHASYDRDYVTRWWSIQLQTNLVMNRFRSSFRGKSSPIHFFWGSFDLNGTRFSGKRLPDKTDWPKGYAFMRYAENEENFAFGFWPGNEKFPHPAFYSYLYPSPKGYETIKLGPNIAYFYEKLSEYILPYEEVRKTKNPEEIIMNFFETTYLESAKAAGWDIEALKSQVPSAYQA